jgi:uncharacterized membrane protein
MSILKDIPELIKDGIISQETADKINDYYNNKSRNSPNRLFIVFGIFGAILVGLGIILLVAHNWDDLSQTTKSFFAFLPLLVGQILCGYVLIKEPGSVGWRESATAFLFFSVGACISLITQIYNIPGNLSSFLLTWMLLCLPLIYLMQSSITSLLYLTGITYYAVQTSYWYWSHPSSESYLYWLLLLAVLPHYYLLYKKKPESNFMIFHNWLVPLSIIICLGTVAKNEGELMYIAYFSLFGLFYLIGRSKFFQLQKLRNNGYKILGSSSTIVLLLALSFDGFWHGLRNKDLNPNEVITSPEFFASAIISLLGFGILYFQQKNKASKEIEPIALVSILFIITFIIGLVSPVSVVFINLFVFAIGLSTIFDGAKKDHLGILNYGLLIILVLAVCRFFDTDLSFIIRGLLFVSVGIGFFATNYWMLKKRKANE